jgi:hypothetical protein
LAVQRTQGQRSGVIARLSDVPVPGHYPQVICPALFLGAEQLGVDHLAIELLLRQLVDIAERSDLAGFAQVERRIRIVYFRLGRGAVIRSCSAACAPATTAGAPTCTAATAISISVAPTIAGSAAVSVTPTAPATPAIAATVSPAIASTIAAAVSPAIASAIPAAVASAIPAAVASAIPAAVASAIPAAVASAIPAAVASSMAAAGASSMAAAVASATPVPCESWGAPERAGDDVTGGESSQQQQHERRPAVAPALGVTRHRGETHSGFVLPHDQG